MIGRFVRKLVRKNNLARPFCVDPQRPKWMKFFEFQSESQYDIDRSLLTGIETPDLTKKMITENYPSFSQDQLIKSMELVAKIDKKKILRELFKRSHTDGLSIKNENLITIINQQRVSIASSPTLTKAVFIVLFEQFKELSIGDKISALEFFTNNNYLHDEIINEFVEALKLEENQEYFNNLDNFLILSKSVWIINMLNIYVKGEHQEFINEFCSKMTKKVTLPNNPSFYIK